MKNLYYLKRNIEYRLLEFYELLTTYRKQIVIPASLVLITFSFFYPELQSKHVRPLATNVQGLPQVGNLKNKR